MGNRVFTDPRPQQFKKDGVTINSNGKLYFYEPGATSTTLKTVYSDAALSVPLTNPVLMDDQGRFPTIYMQESDYAVKLTDSSDVQIWRVDNYQPVTLESQFNDWDASVTYAVNDFVRYSNGLYYISLQSANKGKIPTSSPTYWSQGFFLTVYNSSATYSADDVVYYDGNLYTSLQNSNTGNTPDTSYTYWKLPGSSVPAITNYQGYTIGYIYNSSIAYSGIDMIAALASAGVYESFGPTGSGADNIWSAMDSLPDNTVALTLEVSVVGDRQSGSSEIYALSTFFKATGTLAIINGPTASNIGSATEPSRTSLVGFIDIPLDSNKRFDCSYSNANTTNTPAFTVKIIGFKTV